jgi:hypothetical protein
MIRLQVYLRDKIPNTQATFTSGEGHFFILKCWGGILDQLVEGSKYPETPTHISN